MKDKELFDPRPSLPSRRLNLLPANPQTKDPSKAVGLGRFPSWLHRRLPHGDGLHKTSSIMSDNSLHTVCEEAKCPNLLECWSKKTATFLVMGKECTRSCGFCNIDFSKKPQPLDEDEPERVVNAVKQLKLRHVVITMVARDDIPDGGAEHLSKIVSALRKEIPEVTIELLTSDFRAQPSSLELILSAKPEIFNHNIETVRALTPRVRHIATYDNTLSVLKYTKKRAEQLNLSLLVKSGLMVGLGETSDQVHELLRDLKDCGCDIVTIGQYLQPNRHKLMVKEFITPERFKAYEEYGYSIGIPHMYCGPFVRSSYNADFVLQEVRTRSTLND